MISLIPLMGLAPINHGWRIMMERFFLRCALIDCMQLSLPPLNLSWSAFLGVTFKRFFFDTFRVTPLTARCSVLLKLISCLSCSKNVNTDSFHDCYRTTLFSAVLKPVYGFKSFHNTLCKMQPHKSIVSANGNSIQFLCVS
jgi:hypothetical protein